MLQHTLLNAHSFLDVLCDVHDRESGPLYDACRNEASHLKGAQTCPMLRNL